MINESTTNTHFIHNQYRESEDLYIVAALETNSNSDMLNEYDLYCITHLTIVRKVLHMMQVNSGVYFMMKVTQQSHQL